MKKFPVRGSRHPLTAAEGADIVRMLDTVNTALKIENRSDNTGLSGFSIPAKINNHDKLRKETAKHG
jgi:hypothetical protein